ncbi:hypothetical protein DSO57_1004706 [Entomophthora muscae]|uniref:Uncharacterized protein n=1 Tax=Entomophthora muscae TaxID=34485 RepID=A0ACC2SXF6_9FUNG|nr:hypothetical protein DSO57_1004706 [Entomophthora muscae]
MIPYYFLPNIFQYLAFDDQRQLRLVSKEWNGFLLPFVFSKFSTGMRGELEKYLRKYGEFARELCVISLDDNMIDLLSACKNTTRLYIDTHGTRPEAAIILGEKLPHLSYLELYYADCAKVRSLGPLTRKVQTLYYYPKACDDPEEFMTYYRDFDCPLVTHLIIHEEWALAGENFLYIIGRFPALKTFDYTGPYLHGYQFDHFVYDVENMVFKEISLADRDAPMSAFLRFQDDIPPKTPLFSSVKNDSISERDELAAFMRSLKDMHSKTPLDSSAKKITHESQLRDLFNAHTYKFFEFIPRFNCLDAIDVSTPFIDQEEFIELLLSLKDTRSLSFDFGYQDFSPDLCKETFKATTVFLEVNNSKLTLVLEWLTSCFPNLEELSINLLDGPANYDETKSEFQSTFELWEKMIESRPNLSRIHLPNDVFTQCQIEKKYPHILVDNKCKARYYRKV